MSFIEQDSRNRLSSAESDESRDANFFAFFGKPSPENLSANRSGVLTQQQRAALQANFENQKTNNLILTGMLIFAGLFICFLFWKIDMQDGALSITGELLNAGLLTVVLSLFAGWLTGDWYVFSPGDDLNNGVVESSAGKVEWTGRRYRMRTPAHVLRSLRSRVPMPPGDYLFYYLPHTRLVVMAEQLPGEHREDPATILRQVLSNTHHFSADDLGQNQKGMLSKPQENRLLQTLALCVLILLIGAAVVVSMTSRILQGEQTAMLFMLLMIGLLLVFRFGWFSARIMGDVWRGKVDHIDGKVLRQRRRSRYRTTYLYVVDRHTFEVSAAAYEAIVEGLDYRVFFVPYSRKLVSIEPLQKFKEANNDLSDHTA